MAEIVGTEHSISRPASPSISSTTFLESDVHLNGVDLEEAAQIIREHENQPPASSSPSKQSGPPSAEKLKHLRAGEKVSVNFDPPQKLFARPSSAGRLPTADGFSFGKATCRKDLASTSKQQAQGSNSSSSEQHEVSKPVEKGADLGSLARPAFDLSTFDIRPLHMVAKAEAEAERALQLSKNVSPATSVGSGKVKKIADATDARTIQAPVKQKSELSDGTRLRSVSVECQPSSKRSTPKKARPYSKTANAISPRDETDPSREERSHLSEEQTSREMAEDGVGDILPSIENIDNVDRSRPSSRTLSCNGQKNTRLSPKVLDPIRVTKTIRKNKKAIARTSESHLQGGAGMEDYSEEDLFMLLLNKSRQAKTSNARAVAKQKQMASTINQLCQANEQYQSQLNEARELERTQAVTLGEQERASEDVRAKFAALKNFAKGLTNDFESIRKEGDNLRKLQSQVAKARDDLTEEIDQAHKLHENSTVCMNKFQRSIAGLHGKIDSVTIVNSGLQSALKKEESLLQEEKQKTAQLEQQILSATIDSDKHVQFLKSQNQLFADRLEILPRIIEKLDDCHAQATSSSPDLQECLEIVKTLQAAENVVPGDLESLQSFVESRLIEKVETSLAEVRNLSNSFQNDHGDAQQQIHNQLAQILQGVEKAEDSREKIFSLQEAKIRLEERLTAKADTLTDRNLKLNELSTRERSLLENIPQMKNELAMIREKCPASPSSPSKGNATDHWKSLVEEYRLKWMSINSEKIELAKELAATADGLKAKGILIEDKEQIILTLTAQNDQLKHDLQCNQDKLSVIDLDATDKTNALAAQRDSQIRSIESVLKETTEALCNKCQIIDELEFERANLNEKLVELQNQSNKSVTREQALSADNERMIQEIKDLGSLRVQAEQVPTLTLKLEQEQRVISEQVGVISQLQKENEKLEMLQADLASRTSENTHLAKQIKHQSSLQEHIRHLVEELEESRKQSASMQSLASELETETGRVRALEGQITGKEREVSELRNDLNATKEVFEELQTLRQQTRVWPEKYNELQEQIKLLNTDVEKKRLLKEQLKQKNDELVSPKSISTKLESVQLESQQKDGEIEQLKVELKKQGHILQGLRVRLSQWEAFSQDSVWTQETQAPADQGILDSRISETNIQVFETPLRATQITGNVPLPRSPSPPRQRRIANRSTIPESSLVVRERLAAAKATQHDISPVTQNTDCILETQISQQDKDLEGPSSDLSDPPESSPTKVNQSSFLEENPFRRRVTETIDDSQVSYLSKAPKTARRDMSRVKRKLKESSWLGRSSPQGEEMLLERHSQAGELTGTTDAQSDEEIRSRLVTPGRYDWLEFPQEDSRAPTSSKLSAWKVPKNSSKSSNRALGEASAHIVPEEQSSRQLREKADSRARQNGAPTEPPPSSLNMVNSVSPSASTIKGKHQPNSGAKRQLESDATENSSQSPNKFPKRNPSAASTRKAGSTSVSFDQVPDPANESGVAQRSQTSLPAGSKKGTIGGKSSHSGGASQKRDRKPRKGSRGDQYGNRFGQALQ